VALHKGLGDAGACQELHREAAHNVLVVALVEEGTVDLEVVLGEAGQRECDRQRQIETKRQVDRSREAGRGM
jgi:hypothetical protein